MQRITTKRSRLWLAGVGLAVVTSACTPDLDLTSSHTPASTTPASPVGEPASTAASELPEEVIGHLLLFTVDPASF